jgi:hypothetical protein
MSRIVLAMLAMIAALALSFDASAQKCKKGYYYDADTGKCVPRRGSG